MRDYKYRGKRKDNGDWVFGSFVTGGIFGGPKEDCYIFFDGHFHEVIPETVDMWTRLKDQYGNEIYGGDILTGIQSEQGKPNTAFETYDSVHNYKCGFSVFGKPMQTGYTKDNNVLYQFMWCNRGHHATPDYYYQLDNIEVVGNRIDNPDWQLNPLQRSSVTNTMNIDPNRKSRRSKRAGH